MLNDRKNIQPEELPALGYRLADELSHADLTPFLMQYVRRRGLLIWVWIAAIAFNVVLLAVSLAWHIALSTADFDTLAMAVLPAILLLVALIPMHEWLHGMAYQWAGAPKVSYIVNWKKLYVAALADRFVIGRRQFYIVALTPFTVVSAFLLIASSLIGEPFWQFTFLISLLLHSLSCLGDFAMINYMQLKSDQEVVTYDDNEKGMSYFWVKDS